MNALFHAPSCPQSSSLYPFFSRLNNIPLYSAGSVLVFPFIHQWDFGFSTLQLLCIKLLWTWYANFTLTPGFSFLLDLYSEVGFPDGMAILILIFWGPVAAQFCPHQPYTQIPMSPQKRTASHVVCRSILQGLCNKLWKTLGWVIRNRYFFLSSWWK